jgi:hypothetical protein
MSEFNIENLNEAAENNAILKACLDVAKRKLTSYGEALEAAVVFLVLENQDLRALLPDAEAKSPPSYMYEYAPPLGGYTPAPRPDNMPATDDPRK